MNHINMTSTDNIVCLTADEGYYITDFDPETDDIKDYMSTKQFILSKNDDLSRYHAVSQSEDGLNYIRKRTRMQDKMKDKIKGGN